MKKRVLFAALLVLAMLTSCAIALADNDVPPPDQISSNPNLSMYEWRRPVMTIAEDDALSLTRVTGSISKVSSTCVSIRAVTEANKFCTVVGGTMYVEQWKNNAWNSYHSTTFSTVNGYSASATNTVTVESGYYYRLVVKHRASSFGEQAYNVSSTGSILVK